MTLLYSRKELKLIAPVVLLASLLLQFQSASCSSSCCFDQRGGAAVGLLQGRRLLAGRGEATVKGLMKPVVAKEAAGHALGEEDKREIITGPNPLHNRR
ncbi:hypothetical protein PAHAL_9G454500 [Panicum hallii]|jgi:hypothetical protein|uniref:Uncharacterized protein n=1 Tax=Panicum hallii TaxID=206008 RepID=A0A2S3IQC5_9POAL|nr:hypothetical protein PAHAL_9G454500 [Panicum hallii]